MDNYTTLTLDQLAINKANPRRTFDDATIEGLAQSILTDGLLQNLVVAKPKGKKKPYTIISGERRYRALMVLRERGELPDDYAVKVDVREGLSVNDSHRIATVENVQRENLTPLEEAEAVAKLLVEGMALADVAAQTGLSATTIRRRLAICDLCDEAKTLLAEGRMTLSQAEALTVGTRDQQRELIGRVDFDDVTAEDIRDDLVYERPSVADAIFPLEQYTGTLTGDLFSEEASTYFDDVEAFRLLQTRAVEDLAVSLRGEGYDPVDVVESYQYWKYAETEDGEQGGAVIAYDPSSGCVGVYKGIVLNVPVATHIETRPAPKLTYTKSLHRYMAMHKSMAVQAGLLLNPRKAKEVAVMALLGERGHNCLRYFDDPQQAPAYWHALHDEANALIAALDVVSEDDDPATGWTTLRRLLWEQDDVVYDKVKKLDDATLDRLHLYLTTIGFGQRQVDYPDTNPDSLFNRVAIDLGTDMSLCWIPDADFLSRRSKPQLAEIVRETGTGQYFGGMFLEGKKSKIVSKMARFFANLKTADIEDPDLHPAYRWIPEPMQFPAVDPDATTSEPLAEEEAA